MKISRIFNNIQKKSFSRFFFSTRNSKTAKKCFYKILNVSAQANFEEIKASYIDLAKKYHPDTKFGDKIQEEKFREILEAYKVLSNESARRAYNQENGIDSHWAYEKTSNTFGENEPNYQKFTSKTLKHEEMSEKVKIDEEFANYFQTKYFKNPEYFHKHPIENDPYEMTSKLVRDKNEIKRKKREDYILHNPYTGKAFYEEKNKEGTEMKTEYIILGLVGVLLFTGYAVGIAVYEASEGKSQVQRTRVLDKGSGYYVKLLPINVA